MLKSKSAGSSSSPSSTPSDRVTVVLFKDHHHPRSFEVSVGWVKKMGLWLGVGALATLISLGLALRFGWVARTSRPEALKRLEQENLNLKTSNESLEQRLSDLQEQVKLSAPGEAPPAPSPSVAAMERVAEPSAPPSSTESSPAVARPTQENQTPPANVSPAVDSGKSPLYSLWDRIWSRFGSSDPRPDAATVTPGSQTFGQPPGPGTQTLAQSGGPAFVPANSWSGGVPAPESLKINLTPAQSTLKGDRLSVKFAIQYIANDGKNQQGRIVLLARSASGLLAYPEGVLNLMDTGTLIAPERGEFFSVGRYREVATEFTLPAGSSAGYREIEVLLFKQDGSILLHQRIDTQAQNVAPPADAGARPPRANAIGTSTRDTLMPPGEDR